MPLVNLVLLEAIFVSISSVKLFFSIASLDVLINVWACSIESFEAIKSSGNSSTNF